MTSVITNDCLISATGVAEIKQSLVITLVIRSQRVNRANYWKFENCCHSLRDLLDMKEIENEYF